MAYSCCLKGFIPRGIAIGHGMSGLYYVTLASVVTCMTVSHPNMEMYTYHNCGQNPVCTSSVLSLCDMEYITCQLPYGLNFNMTEWNPSNPFDLGVNTQWARLVKVQCVGGLKCSVWVG